MNQDTNQEKVDEQKLQEARKLKIKLWQQWKAIHPKMKEKFNNINGKTAQYNVPEKLWQKRTSRKNRVLISWKTIEKNNINIEQIKTFDGGVCVEFVNDDFFNAKHENNKTHSYLKNLVGSNGTISAIVSFRTEDGESGSNKPRSDYDRFNQLIEEGSLDFTIIPISRDETVEYCGIGANDVWKGNTYYSIKGGDQNSIESHTSKQELKNGKFVYPQLFNPATEYANETVCLDLDIMMSYFCLHCHDLNKHIADKTISELKSKCKEYLKTREYDEDNLGEHTNLHEYCVNHPSLKLGGGELVDAIQLNKISVDSFKVNGQENSCVICHNEAANKDIFYFDKKQNFLVSPARPTNLFWSTHLSNMMQQNFNLEEYYEEENERVKQRKSAMEKIKKELAGQHGS